MFNPLLTQYWVFWNQTKYDPFGIRPYPKFKVQPQYSLRKGHNSVALRNQLRPHSIKVNFQMWQNGFEIEILLWILLILILKMTIRQLAMWNHWFFKPPYPQHTMFFIYSSVKVMYFSPQALEFYTERSNIAEPSVARRSKAKRGNLWKKYYLQGRTYVLPTFDIIGLIIDSVLRVFPLKQILIFQVDLLAVLVRIEDSGLFFLTRKIELGI